MKIKLLLMALVVITFLVNTTSICVISEKTNNTIYVDDDGGADYTKI